jgi:hypothetical protein
VRVVYEATAPAGRRVKAPGPLQGTTTRIRSSTGEKEREDRVGSTPRAGLSYIDRAMVHGCV